MGILEAIRAKSWLEQLFDAVRSTRPPGEYISRQLERALDAENQKFGDFGAERGRIEAELPAKRYKGDPSVAKDEQRLIELRNKTNFARDYLAALQAALVEAIKAEADSGYTGEWGPGKPSSSSATRRDTAAPREA